MRVDVSTRKVVDGSRTHFIEVKQNDSGHYLTLTELGREGERKRVLVGAPNVRAFLSELQDAVAELEKLADRPLDKRSYQPWSPEEDGRLRRELDRGMGVAEIAESHKRNEGAIRSRLKKLGLATDL
jgi:hypothetical protein